jgi:hypothetical protein
MTVTSRATRRHGAHRRAHGFAIAGRLPEVDADIGRARPTGRGLGAGHVPLHLAMGRRESLSKHHLNRHVLNHRITAMLV